MSLMILDSSEEGVREGRFFVNWAWEAIVLAKKVRFARDLRIGERNIRG